jgi:queuine tRNA-ribosyltransferase
MPVGTQGTVKGVDPGRLRETGAQMILANTYHLMLRPGEQTVAALGGLHAFMGWDGPTLTDSGGFQVFSLADRMSIDEHGVRFKSHIDGAPVELTPERSVVIQEQLGSDVAMVLDHVVALPNTREAIADAMRRSLRWAARCQAAATRDDQVQFGIVQGGLDAELRAESAEGLVKLNFPGYAIGGLSVGETPAQMYAALDVAAPLLPPDKPRYLMGVGRPIDLLEGIARGVDLFDCVMPTRNGRNALAFTDAGPIRLRNQQHALDRQPLDPACSCPACRHSRGYLRHLFQAGEMLGPILVSIHNVTYYQRLLAEARAAIMEDRFAGLLSERRQGWTADRTMSQCSIDSTSAE